MCGQPGLSHIFPGPPQDFWGLLVAWLSLLWRSTMQIPAASVTQNSDFCFLDSGRPSCCPWVATLCSMARKVFPGREPGPGAYLPHELPAVRDHDLVMPVTCCCKTMASYFAGFYSCLWLKNNSVWFLHHRQPVVIVYFYLFSKYFLSVYNVGGTRNTGLNKWHDPCPREVCSLWGKMDLKQIITEIKLWFKLW